ncbi:hypothetical protein [Natranaeroarchaeum sulfidigenes]|uniref:hypothetical protein n=1 Tax=Natranaeroarchaeum sulfidigenes TaxID=2784880 RepID=UPI001EE598DC|nr:hypothetical protein [Natranaeroarchaeum sulfidigenes]
MSDLEITFSRTLPLFNTTDRDVIQRLLHHAVEDFSYDHPDRKIARDLYHKIREGEAMRLHISEEFSDVVLVVDPTIADASPSDIISRFITDMNTQDGEWQTIAVQLEEWWDHQPEVGNEYVFAFEYLH